MKFFKGILFLAAIPVLFFLIFSSCRYVGVQFLHGVKEQPLEKVTSRTVHIYHKAKNSIGGALISKKEDMLLTAAHVMTELCPNLSCQNLSFKIRYDERTWVFPSKRLECVPWLDLCVVSVQDDWSASWQEIEWSDAGDEDYLIGREQGDEMYKPAKRLGDSPIGVLLDVILRTRYSGSPVLDAKGKVRGTLSLVTIGDRHGSLFFDLTAFLGNTSTYFPEAYFVPASEIRPVFDCRLQKGDCFPIEASLLLKRFERVGDNAREKTAFLDSNKLFWLAWPDRKILPEETVLLQLKGLAWEH